MLPPVLVEGICSLSVGSDRLCLSVVWIMDEDAVVHSEWFGRSVVCLKKEVSVEQAQVFIYVFGKNLSNQKPAVKFF